MERQDGFYWVLYFDLWLVGKYNGELNAWLLPGYPEFFEDSDFSRIESLPLIKPVT